MQIPKTAIISAAGLGSRLGLGIPKCLLEFEGRTLISYQIEALKDVEEIRVVTGYREFDVMNEVLRHRDDVIFIRNSEYYKTSNTRSIDLATRGLEEPFLIVDADLFFKRETFEAFVEHISADNFLIGITSAKSDNAVYVDYDSTTKQINSFSMNEKKPYEWSGLAYLPKNIFHKSDSFVFQELAFFLPLRAIPLDIFEVDTLADLQNLKQFLASQKEVPKE